MVKLISNGTLLIFSGVLFAFVIAEIIFQIIGFLGNHNLLGLKPQYTTITWQKNNLLGNVLLSPNQQGWFVTPSKEYFTWITTNNEGFYDVNHSVEKPRDTYRIVLLGDSFVANLQSPLKQTISLQLQSFLQEYIPTKKFEVIAMGMGDTGTAQQYLVLKYIGLKYKPDLVIQLFLSANDIKNNSFSLQKDPFRPYLYLDNQSRLETTQVILKNENPFKQILKSLRLVSIFLTLRQQLAEAQISKQAGYPIDYHVYDQVYNSDYQQAWALTKRLLLETKLLAESQGSRYLLIVLANNEQVNLNLWPQLYQSYPQLSSASLDLEKPDKLLTSFCSQQRFDCLFLLPFFKKYKIQHPDSLTHFRFDGHFTQTGVDIASSIISNYLRSVLLISDDY